MIGLVVGWCVGWVCGFIVCGLDLLLVLFVFGWCDFGFCWIAMVSSFDWLVLAWQVCVFVGLCGGFRW